MKCPFITNVGLRVKCEPECELWIEKISRCAFIAMAFSLNKIANAEANKTETTVSMPSFKTIERARMRVRGNHK